MNSRLSDRTAPGVVFWFRHDLRLHDQLALGHAVARARSLGGWLLPIYVHDEGWHAMTAWGFQRTGAHRDAWLRMALQDLSHRLTGLGSALVQTAGDPVRLLASLVQALDNPLLVCEDLPAPEEQAQVQALRRSGVTVETVWQSTLMAPEALPFLPEEVPDRFTSFRQRLEREAIRATPPLPPIQALAPLPPQQVLQTCLALLPPAPAIDDALAQPIDQRSAFPWGPSGLCGGETAALAHLEQYCHKGLPHTYKATRNGLVGIDCSSKWSPWLATGALSARQAWAAILAFEAEHGASDSTYWLGFELLWRDHFRWLHCKHGKKLYMAQGLSERAPPPHNATAFAHWCQGKTGQPFIDAGMKELAATAYLSNRMRQNCASYLVHDLACDWRAGAAWFEARLIDYDVFSNQGNWLYISGHGTDPRPDRRFNPELQANTYDPNGHYRKLWAST